MPFQDASAPCASFDETLVAGLFTLKHLHNLSDEALCERWVENPDFQCVCVEVVFQHGAPFDRSSLTRWRQRLGEIAALSQESRSAAHRTGAIESKDLERVMEDTTFQEKAIAHPTEARLTHARGQARGHRGGRAIPMPTSSSAPGGSSNLCAPGSAASSGTSAARSRAIVDRFGQLLDLALRVRHQEQRQRGSKSYSLREPEAEYIGTGKARAPYKFGCKVWITTPATTPKGRTVVLHAKALPRNPYDGHTLGPVIADLERLKRAAVRRIHGDKGYRGHNYPNRFKVWISGKVRQVTKAIRRECAVAPPSSRDWLSQGRSSDASQLSQRPKW